MPKCEILGCKPSLPFSLFGLPLDVKKRTRWISTIKLHQKISHNVKTFYVCDKHFSSDVVRWVKGRKNLNEFAVPSIFPRKVNVAIENVQKANHRNAIYCDGCTERDEIIKKQSIQIEKLRGELKSLAKRIASNPAQKKTLFNGSAIGTNPTEKRVSDGTETVDQTEDPLKLMALNEIKTETNFKVTKVESIAELPQLPNYIQNQTCAEANVKATFPPKINYIFACYKCGIHFKRSNDWREHAHRCMITHDNESYSPDNETNTVELSTTQPTHSEQDHKNMGLFTNPKTILLTKLMKPFKCGRCGECFEHTKELSQHMSEHCPRIIEPERKIASMNKTSIKYEHCTICDRKVEEIEMALHFCGSEQQINCAYCPEILTSTKQLVEHLKSHNDNIKIFKCSKCSKSFSMKILMEYHQRSHKENEKRPASAEISAKYMSANHSNTAIESRLCEQCGVTLSSAKNLQDHIRTHQDPTIKCPECPQVFRNTAKLKMHSYVHRNIKCVCQICGAEKSSPHRLTAHMKLHHSSNNVQRVECKICFKTLKRCNYNGHMKLHTDSTKRYKCDYCSQTYKHAGDLIKHKRTHLGDKIYKCDQCDERFKFHMELKKHSFEHYKEQQTAAAND